MPRGSYGTPGSISLSSGDFVNLPRNDTSNIIALEFLKLEIASFF